MKHNDLKKFLSLSVCIVLLASVVLFTAGCGTAPAPQNNGTATFTDGQILGEGKTFFYFTVTDAEGNEVTAEIHTDKKIVGDALIELGLIAGKQEAYGLYVQTVSGITLDFDADGSYWGFYVDGEYAMLGVDMTEIVSGTTYMFKAEKV